MLRQELPTDLTSYLVEVRHIDAVLRSSNPDYTNNKVIPQGNYHPLISPIHNQAIIPPEDPMDLSAARISPPTVMWSSTDAINRRKPINEAEKIAKRAYCFENKICSWCYDPGHRARFCAEAPWNKGKVKSADNKTINEAEKA
ncbi:hypothetical protein K3495_g15914 [Podosphaera aphanis]|nr:hypothetical protein K3495_g15914 [Podosphaera aphanis]